jgi:hypothetical protein
MSDSPVMNSVQFSYIIIFLYRCKEILPHLPDLPDALIQDKFAEYFVILCIKYHSFKIDKKSTQRTQRNRRVRQENKAAKTKNQKPKAKSQKPECIGLGKKPRKKLYV